MTSAVSTIRPLHPSATPVVCRYALVAHDAARAEHLRLALAALGCHEDVSASVVVVLDVPHGIRLLADSNELRPRIVVTDMGSPEYFLDLGDEPGVLGVLAIHNLATLRLMIEQLHNGHIAAPLPRPVSLLSHVERQILRGVAHGESNKDVGSALGLSEKTVRNTLTTIYETLSLTSRNAALLYYWGLPLTAGVGFNSWLLG